MQPSDPCRPCLYDTGQDRTQARVCIAADTLCGGCCFRCGLTSVVGHITSVASLHPLMESWKPCWVALSFSTNRLS